MEAVACAYWPTTLPLLQRLAFPSYVGFGVCLAPKSTLPKPSLVFNLYSDFSVRNYSVDSPGSDSGKCQHEQGHR